MALINEILKRIYSARHTYTTSADMTSPGDLTAAPPEGQHLVVTDILIGADTQMFFVFQEETSGTVIGTVDLILDDTKFISPRGKWKLPGNPGLKLQGDASASGNIHCTVWYYYE